MARVTDTGQTFRISEAGILPVEATIKVAAEGRKLFLPGTADLAPARLHAYADPGGARGGDERRHVGSYAIKEPFPTAASLGGAYGGGRDRKRRRQFADTAAAVGERDSSRAAYVERGNWWR